MTEWNKPNLQHFLFQAFWILCSSKHYLCSLPKYHSRILVKFNWSCLKTEETRKIYVQNITGWNWRGQHVPRQLFPEVTAWKVFFKLFILFFQQLKQTLILFYEIAPCDEFICWLFVLVPQSLSPKKTSLLFSVLFLHRIHTDDGKLNPISFHKA